MREQLHFDNVAGMIAVFAFIVSAAVFVAMFIHAWRVPSARIKHLEELPLDKKGDDQHE